MDKNLNSIKIISLLHELDNLVKKHCRIIICGGAAAIVGYGVKRVTGDIDIFEPFPKDPDFYKAAKKIEEIHGLDSKWLNDGAKGFADCLGPDFKKRLVPLAEEFKNLEVYVLGKPDLLTMKIRAWREPDRDDILSIGVTKADLAAIDENIAHMQKHCPALAYKALQVLSELGLKKTEAIKAENVSNLAELIQYYKQEKGTDASLEEIREWKNRLISGIKPSVLSRSIDKGRQKDRR